MAIRTISSVAYSRNRAFWFKRQRRGDEIRITRLQRLVAILYGLRNIRATRRNLRAA